jgi:hypothetical protein
MPLVAFLIHKNALLASELKKTLQQLGEYETTLMEAPGRDESLALNRSCRRRIEQCSQRSSSQPFPSWPKCCSLFGHPFLLPFSMPAVRHELSKVHRQS